jgi:hypothetical protein
VKALDVAIILAVLLVDDLRNALAALIINSDVTVLAIILVALVFLDRNQTALGSSLGSFDIDLAAPLSKLKSSLDPSSGVSQITGSSPHF